MVFGFTSLLSPSMPQTGEKGSETVYQKYFTYHLSNTVCISISEHRKKTSFFGNVECSDSASQSATTQSQLNELKANAKSSVGWLVVVVKVWSSVQGPAWRCCL